jgi:hypothetical protein
MLGDTAIRSASEALHWPTAVPGEVAEWLKALAC